VALDSHEVVIAGFKALDAAIVVILILCAVAGIGFMSIAMALRKAKGKQRVRSSNALMTDACVAALRTSDSAAQRGR